MKSKLTLYLLLTACIIISHKYIKGRQCLDLCLENNSSLILNEEHLLRELNEIITTPFSPVELIVFLDPVLDCPSCIDETSKWLELLDKEPIYGVTFIMPKTAVNDGMPYRSQYDIKDEQCTFVDESSPLWAFHTHGVLKIVLTNSNHIAWFELGNKEKEDYEKFLKRLATTITEVTRS